MKEHINKLYLLTEVIRSAAERGEMIPMTAALEELAEEVWKVRLASVRTETILGCPTCQSTNLSEVGNAQISIPVVVLPDDEVKHGSVEIVGFPDRVTYYCESCDADDLSPSELVPVSNPALAHPQAV
jgi:hypothetical protein